MATVQGQARPTMRLSVAFVLAAGVAALVPADTGRWLPLHLFLAGAVVLAISGASQLFAVTWSAGPAPPGLAVVVQRWALAVGAVGVVVARELDWPTGLLGVFGGVYVTGVLGLVALLVATVAQGVERRFDAPVRWYVAGLGCGVAAVGVGLELAGGADGDLYGAHVVLNLLGLVGLVIGGTLPFFVATEARTRMSSRATDRRVTVLLAWMVVSVVVAATALASSQRALAASGLVAYAAGLAVLAALLPALRSKQFRWAGPRLAQLLAGLVWWAGVVLATAIGVAGGDRAFAGDTLLVLVVAGYGQVLWASLAYLLPVLRAGGHRRLTAGFATTRSWPALVAANLAGVALVAGQRRAAAVLVGAWLLDAAARVVRVELGRDGREERAAGGAGAAGPEPG